MQLGKPITNRGSSPPASGPCPIDLGGSNCGGSSKNTFPSELILGRNMDIAKCPYSLVVRSYVTKIGEEWLGVELS